MNRNAINLRALGVGLIAVGVIVMLLGALQAYEQYRVLRAVDAGDGGVCPHRGAQRKISDQHVEGPRRSLHRHMGFSLQRWRRAVRSDR